MKQYSEKERKEAIDTIVELINKYKLNIIVDHQIKIIPMEVVDEKENA